MLQGVSSASRLMGWIWEAISFQHDPECTVEPRRGLVCHQAAKKKANLRIKNQTTGCWDSSVTPLSSHSLAQLVQTADTHFHHQHLYCRFHLSLCCTNVSCCCISVSPSPCSRFIRVCHYFWAVGSSRIVIRLFHSVSVAFASCLLGLWKPSDLCYEVFSFSYSLLH